jgi:DNA-binding response OmpR family regulator
VTNYGRILVIEDDDMLRETLRDVFEDEGHEVRTAVHGADAFETLAVWEPTIIVLDLMMPVMDGLEFRERQDREGIAQGAKILILSAARHLDQAAKHVSADAYLAKPFHLKEVLGVVDELARSGIGSPANAEVRRGEPRTSQPGSHDAGDGAPTGRSRDL